MKGNELAVDKDAKADVVHGSLKVIVLTHSNSSPSFVMNLIVT